MILLSLDPSSTCTGYAVFDGRRIVESGCIRVKQRCGAELRIANICNDVADLVADHAPLHIIVETPPRTPRAARRSSITLPIYGWAVGAVWATCRECSEHAVGIHCIPGDEWIGRQSKAQRLQRVRLLYKSLVLTEKDHDAVDAIALGVWWLDRSIPDAAGA